MRTTFETQKIFGRGRRFALALAFIGGFAQAQTELVNKEMIRRELRLEQYDAAAANLANVKIAILDNDFAGFSAARGVLFETKLSANHFFVHEFRLRLGESADESEREGEAAPPSEDLLGLESGAHGGVL
jgi:hypothetical protein